MTLEEKYEAMLDNPPQWFQDLITQTEIENYLRFGPKLVLEC